MKKITGKLIVVTGLSGAGMSTTLKILEDFDIEVFDNFPLSLVEALIKDTKNDDSQIAIGIDARSREFSPELLSQTVKNLGGQLVFMACDDNVLQRRFTETRRRHPLARNKPVSQGIAQEREILQDIQSRADLTIDTTHLSIHELRHILEGYFDFERAKTLTLSLMSFGFRYGIPREADIVMDVRFLKNPHWEAELKPKTGLDPEVGVYIEKDPAYKDFVKNFETLLTPLLPRYMQEGKNYLTIAIGCTGGRHRSVYTVGKLSDWLKQEGFPAQIEHRDVKK